MGASVAEVRRKLGVSEQTFHPWKRTFAGKGGAEWRQLRQVEAPNCKRKPLMADLTLDKRMLHEVFRISMPAAPLLSGETILRRA